MLGVDVAADRVLLYSSDTQAAYPADRPLAGLSAKERGEALNLICSRIVETFDDS